MKSQLQELLRAAVTTVIEGSAAPMPRDILVEPAKDKKNGDFASNVAMMLAKPLGKPPRAVAEAIVAALPAGGIIEKIEIAGPGFINFFLAAGALQQVVVDILRTGEAFGIDSSGAKGKAMVEFVSANPTGPLHVGHGRAAVIGDCIARVLAANGWDVSPRVLLQRRRRADREPGACPPRRVRKRPEARRRRNGRPDGLSTAITSPTWRRPTWRGDTVEV